MKEIVAYCIKSMLAKIAPIQMFEIRRESNAIGTYSTNSNLYLSYNIMVKHPRKNEDLSNFYGCFMSG